VGKSSVERKWRVGGDKTWDMKLAYEPIVVLRKRGDRGQRSTDTSKRGGEAKIEGTEGQLGEAGKLLEEKRM